MMDGDDRYDVWQYEEVLFIKTLVKSGVGAIPVQYLLDKLKPPYQYEAMSTAYCFGRGQWVHVRGELDVDEIVDENVEPWLIGLAEAGETERLTELTNLLDGLCDEK